MALDLSATIAAIDAVISAVDSDLESFVNGEIVGGVLTLNAYIASVMSIASYVREMMAEAKQALNSLDLV